MTICKTTLSITGLVATLSINVAICNDSKCCYADYHYAEYVIILSVIMLNVIFQELLL